ncbi:MAG: hypothetical protein AAF988_04680 [Pseudomonadota bacterium]
MQINGQKIKTKTLLIAGSIFLLFVALGALLPKGFTPSSKKIPEVKLNLPAIGLMPDLNEAMRRNGNLKDRVELLMQYETLILFSNYREVNTLVSEIIFLWSGLTLNQLRKMNATQAINHFLRQVYGLEPNEPIANNPYLGDRPWPRQFNRMKARLLMMGQGKFIYEGRSYYDSAQKRMVIEGDLSKRFVKSLAKFLKGQSEAKRYRNNFLIFIEETKGFKNLNQEERSLITSLSF